MKLHGVLLNFTTEGGYMEALIDESTAAKYLCLSRSFLRQSRTRGTGPIYRKFGRAVRYLIEDLNTWIEQNGRQNTLQRRMTNNKQK